MSIETGNVFKHFNLTSSRGKDKERPQLRANDVIHDLYDKIDTRLNKQKVTGYVSLEQPLSKQNFLEKEALFFVSVDDQNRKLVLHNADREETVCFVKRPLFRLSRKLMLFVPQEICQDVKNVKTEEDLVILLANFIERKITHKPKPALESAFCFKIENNIQRDSQKLSRRAFLGDILMRVGCTTMVGGTVGIATGLRIQAEIASRKNASKKLDPEIEAKQTEDYYMKWGLVIAALDLIGGIITFAGYYLVDSDDAHIKK